MKKIIVDGDGCPGISLIEKICLKAGVQMVVVCDFSHCIKGKFETVYCEVGHDFADMKIMSLAREGDLVITQDYGLASLVLMKNAEVIDVYGHVINHRNIDEYLNYRYIGYEMRSKGIRVKGHRKRMGDDDKKMINEIKRWIEKEV